MAENENNEITEQRYRELLDSAYPFPSKGMSASVMGQINSIKKKRIIRARIARWGSAAACIVIAATAAITLLPKLAGNSSDCVACVTDAAIAEEEESYIEAPVDRAIPESAEEKESDGDELVLADAPMAMSMDEDICDEECTEDVAEESAYSNGTNRAMLYSSAAGVAESDDFYNSYSSIECEHSSAWRNSFHDIPSVLIKAVGEENYYCWYDEVTVSDPCALNILDFAIHFGLSRDDIYGIGNVWYSLDLPDCELIEENRAEIEEYYISGGRAEVMAVRGMLYTFKSKLISLCGISDYMKWSGESGIEIRDITADEIISHFSLNYDEVKELFDEIRSEEQKEYPDYTFPDTWAGIDYTETEAE